MHISQSFAGVKGNDMAGAFIHVAFFSLLGCVLLDATAGTETQRRNARAILVITAAVTAVLTPILLAFGWAPG